MYTQCPPTSNEGPRAFPIGLRRFEFASCHLSIAELWDELLAKTDKHVDDTGLAANARMHDLVLVTRNLDYLEDRRAVTLDPLWPAAGFTDWPAAGLLDTVLS